MQGKKTVCKVKNLKKNKAQSSKMVLKQVGLQRQDNDEVTSQANNLNTLRRNQA